MSKKQKTLVKHIDSDSNTDKRYADRLYLDILLKEYEMERNKKQSLETRAGLVITILCALSVFIFDKVPLSDLVNYSKNLPFTFLTFLKTLIGYLVYISYGIALGFSMNVIGINILYDIKLDWKSETLYQDKNTTITTFVHQYLQVVLKNRKVNNLKARRLPKAYISSISTITLIILFKTL